MKYCDKITFVVFTFNEETRIERAVRNFRGVGEVLVVDNHSSDRTREIAQATGAAVLRHKNPGWVEDEGTVLAVKAAVTTPWIYWGYADELVDVATLSAIIEAVESGTCRIVSVARKNYYYGAFCHDAYANRLNRVFEKDALDFTGNRIHNFGRPNVADNLIHRLDGRRHYVHHFISNTAKTYLRSIDGYTDIESTRTQERSVFKVIASAGKSFIANYFVRCGYKAGKPGLFLGLQMIYYEFLLSMKAYERNKNLSTQAIERRNDAMRETLLAPIEQQQLG